MGRIFTWVYSRRGAYWRLCTFSGCIFIGVYIIGVYIREVVYSLACIFAGYNHGDVYPWRCISAGVNICEGYIHRGVYLRDVYLRGCIYMKVHIPGGVYSPRGVATY